jgi:prevent-host-death family protein
MKTIEKQRARSGRLVWNLADAKNKFSEVVNLALHNGPQTVTRRGEKVVIISEKAYQKLRGVEASFFDFLFQGPGLEGVDLKRDKSAIRKVSL